MSSYNKGNNFSYIRLPSPPQFDESLFDEVSNAPSNNLQLNQEAAVIFASIKEQPAINETENRLHLRSSQEQVNLKTSRTAFGQFEENLIEHQTRKIHKLYPVQELQEKFEFTDVETENNLCYQFLKRFGNAHTDSQPLTFNDSELDNRSLQTHPSFQSTSHGISVIPSNNQLSQPYHFVLQPESQILNKDKSVTTHMQNQRSTSYDESQNSNGNTITTERGYFRNSAFLPPPYVENDLKIFKVNQYKSSDMLTSKVENTKRHCSSFFTPTHCFRNRNENFPFTVSHDVVSVATNDLNSRNPPTGYNERYSLGSRYECQICRNSFASFLEHQTHMNGHKQEILHRCHKCGLIFKQPSHLKDHNENPLKCDICCKTFCYRGNVKRHKTIHTGERHKCIACNKDFTRQDYLIIHMRTHSGDKPYKCVTCNRGFAQYGTLYNHMRTHSEESPFKCNTCSMAFKSKCHLMQHIRKHTWEKPYKCETCRKSYKRLSSLKYHTRKCIGTTQ